MQRRSFVVVISVLCAGVSGLGASPSPQSAGANDPVRLPPPVLESATTDGGVDDLRVAAAPGTGVASLSVGVDVSTPPLREADVSGAEVARPLGRPASIFSLGSASASSSESKVDEEGSASASSGLGAFDPRSSSIARTVGALAIVLGGIFLLAMVVKRVNPMWARAGRPSGVLEILARYPVARGQQLVLLKLARRIILVHQTKAAMTTIADVSDPGEVAALMSRIEAASGRPRGAAFQSQLTEATADYDVLDRAALRALGRSGEVARSETIDLTRRRARRLIGLTAARNG